jgi:hypothetical protein
MVKTVTNQWGTFQKEFFTGIVFLRNSERHGTLQFVSI